MWIFGYGSLIWNPGFPFITRQPARIEGWVRRFWQGSTDHRGLPGAPGRVVTLTRRPGASCMGMAYQCAGKESENILKVLDIREKGGYHREAVRLLFQDGSAADGIVYVAGPDNSDYLGEASTSDIAAQVNSARGPSGPNSEYVRRLASALRSMGADEPHLYEVEQMLSDVDPKQA
ncbi:MAG: gamma-glutamylcyclotransferase [Pseudomonadota bacterium]|nr:gamma-glutamylcyclotransferase [Pseudomonadota bacterium]